MNVSFVTSSVGGGAETDMYLRNNPARSAAKKKPNTTGVRFIVIGAWKKTKPSFSIDSLDISNGLLSPIPS
jgi:hypothetical protein